MKKKADDKMKWKVGLQNILVSGVKWHKKTFSELFFRISIDTILYIYRNHGRNIHTYSKS